MTTLDVSIWDYDTFDAPCFAANGVERLIVGTSNLAASRDMVQRGRAAGITVEDLYAFIYYRLPHETRDLNNCLALAAELGGIRRTWLDCEAGFSDDLNSGNDTEAPGTTVEYRRLATLAQAERVAAAGLQPGIYTGYYWWRSNMGDSHEFAHLPLWLANYGSNDPANPREPIREVAFGGWTAAAAHQYSSRIGLCGRPNRDHNYWFLEDDMTEADVKRICEEFIGATFPEFIEAYFAKGFTERNGVISDLNPEGRGPIAPWADDARAQELAARFEAAARVLRGQA